MTGRSFAALILGLLAAASAATAQSSLLTRPAHLDVREVTLETGLNQLSQRSAVPIAFSPDLARAVYPVNCSCIAVTVREALDSLLATTGFEYLEMRSRIVVRPKPSTVSSRDSEGSEGRVLGVIRAASDSQPIPAAKVGIANRVGEVLTDSRGHFRLSMGPGSYDLIVRAMGYRPARVSAVRFQAGWTDSFTVFLDPAPIRLDEIVVMPSTYGILQEARIITSHTLTRDDVQTRPHLGEDIFRAVDRLPGVATHDITAKFQIRGGPYDQILTLLDGLELYEPFHLKDADAALSIIDVESVSNVDLITGGFSAEYGDKMAGVFAMETTAPPPDRMITTLGLSIQNVTFKNQGSFSGGQGSWLVSARRGYLDLILDITNAQEEGAKFSPTFYDAFAKTQYLLGSGHLLSVQGLYAGDNVSSREEDGTRLDSKWSSGYAWLTWDADLTDRLSARTIVSAGRLTRERLGADFGDNDQLLEVEDHQRFHFYGIKQDWRLLASDHVMFKWGVDLKSGSSDYDYFRWDREWLANTTDPQAPVLFLSPPDTLTVTLTPDGHEIGTYLASRIRPLEPVTLELGVRYDHQSHTGDHTVAPRVNAAFQLAPRTTLRGAWGYFYQSHGLHELRVADGENEFGEAQRAEHRILGLQHELTHGLTLRVEAYERRVADPLPEYRNLVPQVEGVPEEGPEDRVRIDPTRVRARGIELSADYDIGGRFAWSASYALAAAKDEVNGHWIPRPFDQRHTVHVEFAYRPTPRWSLGWAWQYHSPWPGTPEIYGLIPAVNGDNLIDRRFGAPYGNRMPAYHRLDARAMRHFPLGRGQLSIFFDIFNVYDRENALAWDYVAAPSATGAGLEVQRNFHSMIGVLPTVGARWEF
jgi:outer membrane receptor protein involved in Fe transport